MQITTDLLEIITLRFYQVVVKHKANPIYTSKPNFMYWFVYCYQ